MASELVMPRLSDTMETGTVGKWHKKVGERIARGDVVAEIETDKANMDMEAFTDGVLARILVDEGQSASLGQPIAIVARDEAEAKQIQSGSESATGNGSAAPKASSGGGDRPSPRETLDQDLPEQQGPPARPQQGKTVPEERVKASPLARRVAQERGINLIDVAGTGPGGRITKEDVQSFLQQAAPVGRIEQPPADAPRQQEPAQPPAPGRNPQPVEMTRMQQTIARRMTEARFTKPEFVLTVDVDMTEARGFLQSLKNVEGAPRVGPNDLLIKVTAMALAQHPEANAGWENNTIVRYGNVNIGNAVAIEGGLVAPVIKNADGKTLGQIAAESKELVQKAQNGKLAPHEYEDATFTISNLGMYGIEMFTPIINAPAAAIMGVGALGSRPVVMDGEIVIRQRMHLSVAFDHRVINGAEGAEFLQTLVRLLEHPMLALL